MGRVEAAGDAGNEEDVQIPVDLVDDIQDAVVDYQVSSDPKKSRRPSSLRRPVQIKQQRVIYDLNLELIVSH